MLAFTWNIPNQPVRRVVQERKNKFLISEYFTNSGDLSVVLWRNLNMPSKIP